MKSRQGAVKIVDVVFEAERLMWLPYWLRCTAQSPDGRRKPGKHGGAGRAGGADDSLGMGLILHRRTGGFI